MLKKEKNEQWIFGMTVSQHSLFVSPFLSFPIFEEILVLDLKTERSLAQDQLGPGIGRSNR